MHLCCAGLLGANPATIKKKFAPFLQARMAGEENNWAVPQIVQARSQVSQLIRQVVGEEYGENLTSWAGPGLRRFSAGRGS